MVSLRDGHRRRRQRGRRRRLHRQTWRPHGRLHDSHLLWPHDATSHSGPHDMPAKLLLLLLLLAVGRRLKGQAGGRRRPCERRRRRCSRAGGRAQLGRLQLGRRCAPGRLLLLADTIGSGCRLHGSGEAAAAVFPSAAYATSLSPSSCMSQQRTWAGAPPPGGGCSAGEKAYTPPGGCMLCNLGILQCRGTVRLQEGCRHHRGVPAQLARCRATLWRPLRVAPHLSTDCQSFAEGGQRTRAAMLSQSALARRLEERVAEDARLRVSYEL